MTLGKYFVAAGVQHVASRLSVSFSPDERLRSANYSGVRTTSHQMVVEVGNIPPTTLFQAGEI